MIEEIIWFLCWLVLLYGVHIQFRWCIPVTVWCLKIMESFFLLFLLKLFVFFQVYGNGFDLKAVKNVTIEAFRYTKQYVSKLDL